MGQIRGVVPMVFWDNEIATSERSLPVEDSSKALNLIRFSQMLISLRLRLQE
jgi:hypothetical protein